MSDDTRGAPAETRTFSLHSGTEKPQTPGERLLAQVADITGLDRAPAAAATRAVRNELTETISRAMEAHRKVINGTHMHITIACDDLIKRLEGLKSNSEELRDRQLGAIDQHAMSATGILKTLDDLTSAANDTGEAVLERVRAIMGKA